LKKYQVIVKLKTNVLDPEGKAIQQAAGRMGFDKIQSIRAGKFFEIEVEDSAGENDIKEIAEKILVNPVIETYEIKEA
jgi:phosphoribosylformylglycinamidine synthase